MRVLPRRAERTSQFAVFFSRLAIMGIYDRDYYSDQRTTRGISLGGDRDMVTTLVVLSAGLYIANMLLGGNEAVMSQRLLFKYMSVFPDTLMKPWMWWQLLTYGFAHANISHLFWNMFALWMFGRDVESVYGKREFLRIYLLALVAGSVVWCLNQAILGPLDIRRGGQLLGASGAITAIVLLFILNFPKRTILLMFVLPVPAWVLGVLIILGNVFGLGSPDNVAYDVHLVGAAFAGAYSYFKWNLEQLVSWPKFPRKSWKSRPRLKLHEPEDRYADLDRRADRILEKVHQEGADSISREERRILDDYSRRMRQKHR